jgi:prepilin-type N-terminal cleavage/methylation domain-containing protein
MEFKESSFTLIELLVVIAIVGILAGILIVSMAGAINSANDARRKADIDTIRSALLRYNATTGSYPIETTKCNIGDSSSAGCITNLNSSLASYLPTIPKDPNGGYYTYQSLGTDFTLSANLSNSISYSTTSTTLNSTSGGITGYTYRKSHTIIGSTSGAQTDYQMKFTIMRSTGTDSAGTVYLGSKVDSSYKDIYFTDSNMTPLSYWIESSDSSSAVVWVKIPTVPASPSTSTIYLYYGNASATSASNGNSTFAFFDHFEGTSLDANKWTKSGTGTTSIASSFFTINGNSSYTQIKSVPAFGQNYSLMARCDLDQPIANDWYNQDIGFFLRLSFTDFNNQHATSNADGNYADSTDHHQIGTFLGLNRFEITRDSSSSVIYSVNNNLVYTQTNASKIDTNQRLVYFQAYASGKRTICDWISVRKYISNEPTHSSWGIETSN